VPKQINQNLELRSPVVRVAQSYLELGNLVLILLDQGSGIDNLGLFGVQDDSLDSRCKVQGRL
jgi:hypothetical protein